MTLTILEEAPSRETFEAHATVPTAFRVDSRFRVELMDEGLGGFRLVLEPVETPYTKDYDSDKGERPTAWTSRWDVSRWGVLAAYEEGRRIGGAVVAFETDDVWFLEGRKDVAALWDIRVTPHKRRGGIGKALFEDAAEWARQRGCRLLKIETQNVNVGACRFYASVGCVLGAINRFAYLGAYGVAHPDEVQLVWYYELT